MICFVIETMIVFNLNKLIYYKYLSTIKLIINFIFKTFNNFSIMEFSKNLI